MRFLFFPIAMLLFHLNVSAQKYLTQTGSIRFYSETPMENIEAINNQVSGVLDASTGQVAFSLLMKAFSFEKALMQEHFNEKYVESERFPKATFKGHVANWSGLELSSRATPVTVAGELTIHGVTRTIEAQGTLTATGPNGIHGESVFTVEVADYDIKIPGAVRDNIAKTIQITVKMDYEKMD